MSEQNSSNKKLIIILTSLAALGTAGAITYNYYAKPKFKVETKTTQVVTISETTSSKPMTDTYKNGSYTSKGMYKSPGGDEEIAVTLTIKDNKVENAEVIGKSTLPISIKFQDQFISGYKEQVIGRLINDIKLDKVSGSSLTPKGFNEALTKIKEQAKS